MPLEENGKKKTPSLIQNITNNLKKKIFIVTDGFKTNTKEPYQRFLEFVWTDFQNLTVS